VIQEPKAHHSSVYVLSGYFERAVEELGLRAWFNLLIPGKERYFQGMVKGEVLRFLDREWRQDRDRILSYPEGSLRWEPSEKPEEEIRSHYILQAAIVATLIGFQEELKTLAALLVSQSMNRKLAISYFLGNLTDGRVGTTYKELPTKDQVLQWVRDIDQIQSTYKLDEIARLKTE